MADLSISKAWDETKATLAHDGRLFASISLALIGLPSAIVALFAPQGLGMQSGGFKWVDLLTFAYMLLSIIGQLALIRLALKPSITVAGAIDRGARRMPIYLLSALILVAGLLVLAIPFGIAAKVMGIPLDAMHESFPAKGWLLVLLFCALVLFLAVRLMMTTPVASAEKAGPIAIIQRSWNLTKGHTGRLLGFLLMIIVALVVVMMVVALVAGSIASLLLGAPEPMSASALFIGIVQGLFNAAFTAIFAVMLARIYVQLSGRDTVEA